MDTNIQSNLVYDKLMIKRTVNKNIIILLLGKFVSLFGSSIYSFAISLYILKLTGSALNFSLTLALSTLPRVLLAPVSGVIADRVDRKKMVVIMDILSGVAVLALFTVSYFDQLRLIYIYISIVSLSICNIFFNTALSASIPSIVDRDSLTRVNSLSQSIASITQIAGPFIGGLIFAVVDIKLFLLVNGLSFVFSGISEMFINFNVREMIEGKLETVQKKLQKDTSFKEDFIEGLKYIKSERWLLVFGGFVIFLNVFLMIGLTVPVPYIVNQVWGFSEIQYGTLNIMFPVGMLIGSVVLSILPQTEKNFKRTIAALIVFDISILSIGLLVSEVFFKLSNSQYLIVLMIIFAIIAMASVIINIPLQVTMQKRIPNDKMGRVGGTLETLSTGLMPLGAIIAGFLMDLIPPYILPISCGILLSIITILMYRSKELKNI